MISAIRKICGNKLSGKTETDLEINNECTRLIANYIIYYNAAILSSLFNIFKKENNTSLCDLIKRLSPVAWQHINLVRKYEFCQNQIVVNIQEVIEKALSNFKIDFGLETPN